MKRPICPSCSKGILGEPVPATDGTLWHRKCYENAPMVLLMKDQASGTGEFLCILPQSLASQLEPVLNKAMLERKCTRETIFVGHEVIGSSFSAEELAELPVIGIKREDVRL